MMPKDKQDINSISTWNSSGFFNYICHTRQIQKGNHHLVYKSNAWLIIVCISTHYKQVYASSSMTACVSGNTLDLTDCKQATCTLHALFCYAEGCSRLINTRAPQSSLRQAVWLLDCGRICQCVLSVYVTSWIKCRSAFSFLYMKRRESTCDIPKTLLSASIAQCRVCFIL